MKKIIERIRSFFTKITTGTRAYAGTVSEGRRGALIALYALLLFWAFSFFYGGYTYLPLLLAILIGVALSAAVPAVLYAVFFLLFGSKSVTRALFITELILLSFIAIIACQGKEIVPGLLFALLLTTAVDLLGRCAYLWIFKKNGKKSVLVTGICSVLVILLVLLFLIPDGFAAHHTERYAKLQKDAKTTVRTLQENAGENATESLTYGPGEDDDLCSETVDLSAFAKRGFLNRIFMQFKFRFDLDEAPVSGKIWLPKEEKACPVLFIIHGNHGLEAESYLGYEYLGEYLSQNGYAVVSVDENCCNTLSDENDARAVLLLENVKQVLAWNVEKGNVLEGRLDPERITLAGHSRGGEAVCIAALFNRYTRYPENANLKFDYGFSIRSLIAIAPTTEQYMPAGKTFDLSDVSYLLIHGSNDQDVSKVMGEKQYDHIHFTKGDGAFASSIYVIGANHGQFNALWGRYDTSFPQSRFFDVAGLMTEEDQHLLLCKLMRAFLDVTLLGEENNKALFYDINAYREDLPDVAFEQTYRDDTFRTLFDFNEANDPGSVENAPQILDVSGAKEWTEKKRKMGSDGAGENYALAFHWGEDEKDVRVVVKPGELDLSQDLFSFNIADMREKKEVKDAGPLDYSVIFTDADGNRAVLDAPVQVLPTVCVKLYKFESLLGHNTYKHQFTTVRVNPADGKQDPGFDAGKIKEIEISFHESTGDIELDDIGICKAMP